MGTREKHKMKLLTVIGARPQIIKAAAVSRAIANKYAGVVEEVILHTGQHYDENMSKVFFDELGIPQPMYNLGVGSGKHGEQTAKMIDGIEKVLLEDHYDGIVLYGDTNSTIAGSVAASKIHVPIFHIEAGLRSFNMSMPEEINRIVCDQLSSICFAPTETAVCNLRNEGFMESTATFLNGKKRIVKNCGDVMYDNSMYFAPLAHAKSTILRDNELVKNDFILATIHRPYNTDSTERLSSILSSLLAISEQYDVKLVFPLHPRTKNLLSKNLDSALHLKLMESCRVNIIPPASFFDMIELETNARIIMTDSGGVQKEAFFFERPCVILRPETEWVEIVDNGAGVVADADFYRITTAYDQLCNQKVTFPKLFGDAHAAEHIVESIIEYLF